MYIKCPNCGTDINDKWVVCPNCEMRMHDIKKMLATRGSQTHYTPKATIKRSWIGSAWDSLSKAKKAVLVLLCVIASVALFMILPYEESDSSGSRPRSTTEKSRPSSVEYDVYFGAIEAVKGVLKAPSTAKFCSVYDCSIQRNADGSYMITGYVDAQNSYGAMLRNTWDCKMELKGGVWRALSIDVY